MLAIGSSGVLLSAAFAERQETLKKSLRWICIIFYIFAAFWNLNSAFLDPAVSCVIEFAGNIFGQARLDSLSSGSLLTLIYGALAIELLIPLLLVFPRLRRYGLVLAVGFHFLLIFDLGKNFLNFSAVMFCYHLCFLDQNDSPPVNRAQASLMRVVAILFSLLFCVQLLLPVQYYFLLFQAKTILGLCIYSFFLALVVFAVGRQAEPQSGVNSSRAGLSMIAASLVIIIGISPIIGWRTGSSWQMYSNSVQALDYSNHLLLSAMLKPPKVFEDQITIVEPSNLLQYEHHYPRIEFYRFCSRYDCSGISYQSGEKVLLAGTQAEFEELYYSEFSLLQRKFHRYQAISPVREKQGCFW